MKESVNNIFLKIQILFTLFYFLGCANKIIPAKIEKDIFLADPTIFLDDGTYYLYGTSDIDGFKVYTSGDLNNWEYMGIALSKDDSYGSRGFWAPHIFKYNNKYFMAYTADENIAIAESKSPLGPFKQKEFKNIATDVQIIDPFVFFDNGKIYLYHVRLQKGNRIFVVEMHEDLSGIIPSTLRECIYAEEVWEDTQNGEWKVAEGPSVFKKEGKYYMLYSANDFRNPDYAVGIAVADHPSGPWKKSMQNPILSGKNIKKMGTGHGELFLDKQGKYQYVFHTHFSDTIVSPRKTAIIQFQNGFPKKIHPLINTFQFLKSN